MLLGVFHFALRCRLGRISTWIYAGLFLLLALLMVLAAGGALGGARLTLGGSKVLVNAPFTIALLTTLLGYFGLLVTAAIAGRAVQQDFEDGVEPLLFSTPMTKLAYLGGRLLAALVVSLGVFAMIPLGARLGAAWPWLGAGRVGPNQAWAYLQPMLLMVLPNLVFTGAIFFSIAALTRKIVWTYACAVVLLIGYLIAPALLTDLDNKLLASLLDPFGLTALRVTTEYWTVAERNTLLLPLEGPLLFNRLLWITVAAVVLALTYRRFRFSHAPCASGAAPTPTDAEAEPQAPAPVPAASGGQRDAGFRLRLTQLLALAWQQLRSIVGAVHFIVIMLAGLLFMVVSALQLGKLYDTPTYPVTYQVLDVVGGSFGLFIVIVITVYAGELVWRERRHGLAQIVDATPLPSWLQLAGKLLGLAGVVLLLTGVILVFGVTTQAVSGFYELELGQYLVTLLGINLPGYLLLIALALFVQVLVNQKYLGHLVMVTYYVATVVAYQLGVEHPLFQFGEPPRVTYSDMNGYGPFLWPHAVFTLYWAALAAVLVLLARLLWVRGVDVGAARRLRLARARAGPAARRGLIAAGSAFLLLGGYAYYNTNILNTYRSSAETERLRVDYERRYKRLAREAQPRIEAVKLKVEIYPTRPALQIDGRYRLRNTTDRPVRVVHLNIDEEATIRSLRFGRPTRRVRADRARGFHSHALAAPLQPGQELALSFSLSYTPRGFSAAPRPPALVDNGTFVGSFAVLPRVGYDPHVELSDRRARARRGLATRPRMPDLDDRAARRNNYVTGDADWVSFEAVVGTAGDQTAITSGDLQRSWRAGGRRYFHYRAEGKILNFFPLLSGRYVVARDRWRDVALAVYHHPGHEHNVARMLRSARRSLDYCTSQFGPYQFKQLRIVEFPRYQTFAQSYPGTIPYSESVGFIAKVDADDPEDIDYPFYVTAHEVAHQWWAHQVVGANVQGATLLSEALAQYSALMVMERAYGRAKMRKFLRYELHNYLRGRALEREQELPLLRVENQGYVHYNKGSLAMYALRDYIGEAAVNGALASFRREAHHGPPYATSRELLQHLRAATPPRLRYLIGDLFESITLYDNRACEARARRRADGRWEVTIEATARKLRADGNGRETEVPLADWIEIGVLGRDDAPLYLNKHKVERGAVKLTVVVRGEPRRAGIDPYNKLIDRKPDDNQVAVAR